MIARFRSIEALFYSLSFAIKHMHTHTYSQGQNSTHIALAKCVNKNAHIPNERYIQIHIRISKTLNSRTVTFSVG